MTLIEANALLDAVRDGSSNHSYWQITSALECTGDIPAEINWSSGDEISRDTAHE